MFYKVIENSVITMIGTSTVIPIKAEEINENKYKELLNTIQDAPQDTLDAIYCLSAETETYIPRERTHDETVQWYVDAIISGQMVIDEVPEEYKNEVNELLPEPTEQTYTLDEAATLLASEVNE